MTRRPPPWPPWPPTSLHSPSRTEGTAADAAVPYPGSVPEDAGPSRRERRRAKRRERRMARGRRLITFRTLLFVILLAAVLVGAFAAVRWYDINSYFVRAQDNELVIYQGRIGGLLWYHPVEVERTGVTTADVPASYLAALDAGVEETSVANARAYVAQPGQLQADPEPSSDGDHPDDDRTQGPVEEGPCEEGSGHDHHHQGALMERRIRRLGIFMLLCFVALFIQLNNIQVLKANSLANSPNNPRVLTAERSQTRGSILSSDGTVLASSVLAPKGSLYKYQRVYNPNTATLFAQIIGFDSAIYGNYRGIEAEYNSFLTPHTPPAKTLRDLLTNRTEVDNVTLTVNENLQLQVAQALDEDAPGVNGAAAVVCNPTTGAIEAMYSNPSFNPNPLVSQNPKVQNFAWDAYLAQPGNPLVAGTYGQTYPPGSSFKVVTTSAVLEHRPDLAAMTYPRCRPSPCPTPATRPRC